MTLQRAVEKINLAPNYCWSQGERKFNQCFLFFIGSADRKPDQPLVCINIYGSKHNTDAHSCWFIKWPTLSKTEKILDESFWFQQMAESWGMFPVAVGRRRDASSLVKLLSSIFIQPEMFLCRRLWILHHKLLESTLWSEALPPQFDYHKWAKANNSSIQKISLFLSSSAEKSSRRCHSNSCSQTNKK